MARTRTALRLTASLTLAAAILTGSGAPSSAGEPAGSHPVTAQPADHTGYITDTQLTTWARALGTPEAEARISSESPRDPLALGLPPEVDARIGAESDRTVGHW